MQVVDYRKKDFSMRPSSKFNCDDADSGKWDFSNGAYSPRNDAYRNAQRFVDMWEKLVGIPPYSKTYNYWLHNCFLYCILTYNELPSLQRTVLTA